MHDQHHVKTLSGSTVTLIASQVKEVAFKLLHQVPGYQVTVFGMSYQGDMKLEADAHECADLKQWLGNTGAFTKNGYGRWFRPKTGTPGNKPAPITGHGLTTKQHFVLQLADDIHCHVMPSGTTDKVVFDACPGNGRLITVTHLAGKPCGPFTVNHREAVRLRDWLLADGQWMQVDDNTWLNLRNPDHQRRTPVSDLLPHAALECLRDVVSHASDIRDALRARLEEAEQDDRDAAVIDAEPENVGEENRSYWRHQQVVFNRMVEQATEALTMHYKAEPSPITQEN